MSPVASAAVVSGDPDRRMVIFRIIEFLFVFPYIITISYTTGHLGWWFYSDMEAAVILGSTASGCSLVLIFAYLINHDRFLRQPHAPYIKRVLYLLFRISVDFAVASLWGTSFILCISRNKTKDFRHAFDRPPYKWWVCSIIFVAIEAILFLSTSFLIVVCYKAPPTRRHLTNASGTPSRGLRGGFLPSGRSVARAPVVRMPATPLSTSQSIASITSSTAGHQAVIPLSPLDNDGCSTAGVHPTVFDTSANTPAAAGPSPVQFGISFVPSSRFPSEGLSTSTTHR